MGRDLVGLSIVRLNADIRHRNWRVNMKRLFGVGAVVVLAGCVTAQPGADRIVMTGNTELGSVPITGFTVLG